MTDLNALQKQKEIELAWEQHASFMHPPPLATTEIKRQWLEFLFEEQGGKCAYCSGEMVLPTIDNSSTSSLATATRDHFVPKAMGGLDVLENFVAACTECNTIKRDIDPKIFMLWVAYAQSRRYPPIQMRHYFRLEIKVLKQSGKLIGR